jgi:hypothetical protein
VFSRVREPLRQRLVVGNSDPNGLVKRTAFTGTDRGLLRSVLGSSSPVPKCEAPGAPISVEEHTSMAPKAAAKISILRFKNLLPFRHYRGLQNHV